MKPAVGPLGQWLRTWRKTNRYSMGAFSELSGVAKAQVFGLEHGTEFNPRLSTLMAISKATVTPIEQVARMAALQRAAVRAERAQGSGHD